MASLDITLHKSKMILSDPVKMRNFLKRNKKELGSWILLFAGLGFIYYSFSDKQFSFSLTIACLVQMFGFFLIALQSMSTHSVSGLSLNAQICYAVSFFFRICSIIRHEAYLPYDKSGDYIYRAGEILSLLLALYVIYMAKSKYKGTYDKDVDRVHCLVLIIPALVLGVLVHPGLNSSYFADISWAISLYLESVAMFPQLYMLFKKGGEVEVFTSHFVASQGIARCFTLIFWIFSYHELNIHTGSIWSLLKGHVGTVVMVFQFLQLVLFSDFLYEYFKSFRKGLPISMDRFIV